MWHAQAAFGGRTQHPRRAVVVRREDRGRRIGQGQQCVPALEPRLEYEGAVDEPGAIARPTPVTRAVTGCAADMAYAAVAEPHQLGDQCPYRSDFIDSRADAVCRSARRKVGEWNFSPLTPHCTSIRQFSEGLL